jgi:hypothetical protein
MTQYMRTEKNSLKQLDSKTAGNVDKAQPTVIRECHNCSEDANLSDHDPITLTLHACLHHTPQYL